jgi:UDP-glucuronate decarboxylase
VGSIIREDILSVISEPLPWEAFSGANVLVTGAAGFLPAYLVETLLLLNESILSRPVHVVALVRSEERARIRFADYVRRDDLQIVIQDVSDPLTISTRFDYIIHAASQASPRFYKIDPVGTLKANLLGTYHLLNAAKEHACKGFLYFSSGDVYGNVDPACTSVRENQGGFLDPADVRSCYGESKRMGETMCVSWAHQFGVPTHIVRPSHTYGPGMRLDDGRVFADFVRDILSGGPISLLSDGSARRCFCYLADATAGFFTVLLKGAAGQAYNVANPEGECTIAELAERLAEMYKEEGISVERKVRAAGSAYVNSPFIGKPPNVDKLKALGWKVATTIEQGFRRTVTSYREDPELQRVE